MAQKIQSELTDDDRAFLLYRINLPSAQAAAIAECRRIGTKAKSGKPLTGQYGDTERGFLCALIQSGKNSRRTIGHVIPTRVAHAARAALSAEADRLRRISSAS